MGLFNWLMKGIGFEGEEQENDSAIASEKRQLKELKKQQKLAKKLEREQKKAMRNEQKYGMQHRFQPSETVFDASAETSASSYDPDQYNISSQSFSGYEGESYSQGGYGNKNVVFFYPKSYSEVQKLISYLKQGESVMLNLDGISDEEAQRMLDFSSGAVYALSGSIQRVSGNIFLLTPEGLGIITPKK